MKKIALLTLFVALMAIVPMAGFAADTSVEGTIQGFTCVTTGNTCPVGKEDAMASLETVFVLLKELPSDYYFLPNVESTTLVRHINEKIRVTGAVNKTHRTLKVSTIESFKNGQWVTVWGTSMQDELEAWEKKIMQGG